MATNAGGQIVFPPFRLDAGNEQLFNGVEPVPLTPKAYAVLHFLATHPHSLVTKEALLDAVWPETHVTEGVLKVAVAEIRKALNDTGEGRRYIETAHRRGYRFIAETVTEVEETRADGTAQTSHTAPVIEREQTLGQLLLLMKKAFSGERQMVFITGETGMGKTTLVDAFAESAAGTGASIAVGQCLEHFAEGEAYFPVLEALTQLCRQPGRERLIETLRRQAPTWLAQMPALLSDADQDRLRRENIGAARERMLREIATAVEVLTEDTPLILILEDLHWSDYSTVDLISHLARRRESARLLFIGTFRPAELIVKKHPLREIQRELQTHRRCSELALEFLTAGGIKKYLEIRFPGAAFPESLPRLIEQRTDGNPLFVTTLVDYLIAQGQLVPGERAWRMDVPIEEAARAVPDSLQQLIERQFERLSENERRLLSVASIAGMEFSTRTLSGGVETGIAEIESCCADLVKRRQFLRPANTIQLRDGSLLERYGFIHAMYQHVLYEGVPHARRAVLHRRIGEFQEDAYSDHLGEIAPELAIHFKEGHCYERAIHYRRLAADKALTCYANREAQEHLGKAVALVGHLSEGERAQTESILLQERGAAHRAMDDNEVAAADFERAAVRAHAAGRTDLEVDALLKLSAVLFWIHSERSLEVAERAVELCAGISDPLLGKHARGYCASRRIRLRGWRDVDFQACAEAGDAAREAGHTTYLGIALMNLSFFEAFRSHEVDACAAADEGMRIGLQCGDSFLYISCQYFKALALFLLGRWGETLDLIHDGIRLSEKNGHGTANTLLRVLQARVHSQAQDFAGARAICQRELAAAREGSPRFLTLIALGEAHVGLGELDLAEEYFEEVVAQSKAGPLRLDWIFHLPLYLGRSELWLRRGDLHRATQEAFELRRISEQSGQRTYLALAQRQLAEIALARNDPSKAEAEIRKAFEVMKGAETPVAEWRVWATAAENADRLGRHESAGYRANRLDCVRKLAASLTGHDSLRRSLTAAFDLNAAADGA